MRYIYLLSVLAIGLSAIGCCGPMGCGPGCKAIDANCYDCEGGCGPRIPYGPLDSLRQWRRSLVCGGGCGEVYYGEWRSSPPDCADPCCGTEFVGGAEKCTPFCWQPGSLLPNLYGRRFHQGGSECETCDSCASGCGECESCGSVMDGPGEYLLDDAPSGTPHTSGCGCASCNRGMPSDHIVRGTALPRGTRMVKAPPLTGSRPMRTAQRSDEGMEFRSR